MPHLSDMNENNCFKMGFFLHSVITPSTARYSLEKRTERLLRLWNEEKITDANILPYQVYDIVKYQENHPVHFESMKSVLWGSDAMDQDQLRLALEVIFVF